MHISYDISMLQISRQYSSATFLSHHGVDLLRFSPWQHLHWERRHVFFLSFQMGPTKYTLNHQNDQRFTSNKQIASCFKRAQPHCVSLL